jgi:hypothetical protein
VVLRYPELHEVTRSRNGIPASARAKVAALIHADLVPAKKKKKKNWFTNRIQHDILVPLDYIFN